MEVDTALVVEDVPKQHCHPRCVEDSTDQTEVSNCTLAQDTRGGAS